MSILVWQLVDSAFPSGGFAHSNGLEAAMQLGLVRDAAGVLMYTRQSLAQYGRCALPIVRAAHDDLGTLPLLDDMSDVFLSNPVANRASRTQGRALLMSACRSLPQPGLLSIDATVRNKHLAAHHAPIFGAVMRALDIAPLDTQRAFLFTAIRAVPAAAVRLGIVGCYEAQSIQAAASADVDRVIRASAGLTPDDIAQTAPLIDLVQSTHDRLYSRLFQS